MAGSGARNRWFGLNWQINVNSGWGVLGLNLALQAEQQGEWLAVPLVPTIHPEWLPSECLPLIGRVLARERTARDLLEQQPEGECRCDFPVIHSMGNWLEWGLPEERGDRLTGEPNLAIIFSEDTRLTDQARTASRRFTRMLAGSTWNAELLRKNGISHVATFLQGIDPAIFHPIPRPTGPRRFVIFSGGKLEYRKGQDIVVAAFREFNRRHPDSILLTGWQNAWPKTIEGIARQGYVADSPTTSEDGRLDIVGRLERNGISRQACHDIGAVPNHLMPQAYKQADVAVLPNRCEGGTNLVAMECMACAIPTILSANTGHLDLIDERHCYPLTKQGPVAPAFPFRGTDGWGESDIAEVVERLEQVYSDRQEAQKRGALAARFMQDWSWSKRFQELIQHFEAVRS